MSPRSHRLSRRRCIAGGLASALLARPLLAKPDDSLESLARAKGLHFGSAVGGLGPSKSFDDERVRELLRGQCGIMTPENELKWIALRPGPERFDFAPGDRLAQFAARNGLRFRGHTLLWNRPERYPEWLNSHEFGSQPRVEAERLLHTHIATVCAHYRDQVFAWDVINETIEPSTGELRQSVFSQWLGDQLIDIAFHAAREAAPNARLTYNDYMTGSPESASHRAGVLRLLQQAKARGVPIDALGVQSHLGSGDDPQRPEWRQFLDAVAGLGLEIVITELDVNDRAAAGNITARDAATADLVRSYLDLMLSYSQLRYVVTWGLVDRYSWLQYQAPRADGLPKRPLPYNDGYRPKPLRAAIAAAFSAAHARMPAAGLQC
jgi:endo-1,4-beta-xylanase